MLIFCASRDSPRLQLNARKAEIQTETEQPVLTRIIN